MSWIDRINRYFLDAIARHQSRATPASTTLLCLSPALIQQLASLYLASHDRFVGDTWMLWGTLIDGTQTAISDTDPDWHAVRAALDQSGRLSVAFHLAELKLLADPNRKPLRLIGDDGTALTAPVAPHAETQQKP